MTAQTVWPQAVKRTKQRCLVLAVLEAADMPVTALDISARLEKQGNPVWLSTIYRILDTFSEHGMAQKAAVLENGMAIYECSTRAHRHYAVCVVCHKVIAIHDCPLESYSPLLQEQNFHVLGHKLQMYGYCGECSTHMRG